MSLFVEFVVKIIVVMATGLCVFEESERKREMKSQRIQTWTNESEKQILNQLLLCIHQRRRNRMWLCCQTGVEHLLENLGQFYSCLSSPFAIKTTHYHKNSTLYYYITILIFIIMLFKKSILL